MSDNKNIIITNTELSSGICLWQILINEYAPKIAHIQGDKNVISDFLSRLYFSKINSNPKNNKNIIELKNILKDFLQNGKYDGTEIEVIFGLELVAYLHEFPGNPGSSKLIVQSRTYIRLRSLQIFVDSLQKRVLSANRIRKLQKVWKGCW